MDCKFRSAPPIDCTPANLPAEENVALYGKCNNLRGHGHRYLTEATIGGPFDERSGTLMDFGAFQAAVAEAVQPWRDKHLDLEMEEFRDKPSTGREHRAGALAAV